MPLKKGASQSVISKNIQTLVHEWEKDGSIGASHPKAKKTAVRQAVAVAMKKARKKP